MITVIVGKTASGKTTITKKLESIHSIHRIVTYTSRPMREGEIENESYYYISNEDFQRKIGEGFFIEWKSHNTEEGVWYYGTALKDLLSAPDNSVIILTPDGYRDVLKRFKDNVQCLYIYANNKTIKERLVRRGDNENEARRRLSNDNQDFKNFENEANRIIYNNEGTDIEEVINKTVEFIKRRE